MSMRIFLCLALLAAGLPGRAQSLSAPGAELLLAADRAFAARALEGGTRQAFFACMADSAIGAEQGRVLPSRTIWEAYPPDGDTLLWAPDFADLALEGDLGYTTGPWRIDKAGRQAAAGHYCTVWQRQADGSFRYLLDMGIHYRKPRQSLDVKVKPAGQRGQFGRDSRQDLRNLDLAFTQYLHKAGPAQVYGQFASPAARLLRPQLLPVQGRSAIVAQLQNEAGYQFAPEGARMAGSGDMGYVYGSYQSARNAAVKGAFVRIWKHEEAEGWRLVLECLEEAPRP